MAHAEAHVHHFYVPHLHRHSPHVEWTDLAERHERAAQLLFAVTIYGLVAALAIALAPSAARLVGHTFTTLNAMGDAAVIVPAHDLPKEWRTPRTSGYDAMYGRVETRDLGWIRRPSAD